MDFKIVHQWDVLAISCIDGRFITRTIDWISEKTGGLFDFTTGVGASKAFLDGTNSYPLSIIETSLKLHNIKEVWLIDHIDCGAYGGSKMHASPEAEKEFHLGKMKEAEEIIKNKFPNLLVKKIYVDWETIEEI